MAGRSCLTCSSPKRAEIDAALRRGEEPQRVIAARFKVSPSSLERHSRFHLGSATTEAQTRDKIRAKALELAGRLADGDGDPATVQQVGYLYAAIALTKLDGLSSTALAAGLRLFGRDGKPDPVADLRRLMREPFDPGAIGEPPVHAVPDPGPDPWAEAG
jgi:hypothetical protein